jgi:3-oxoacyl-[acyl-carrier protein] reductase
MKNKIYKILCVVLTLALLTSFVADYVAEGGELASVASEIKGLGQRSIAVQADITKRIDVDNLVQSAVNKFGRIDILVNNAGITIRTPLFEMCEDDWDTVMNTNLKGYYLCCRAAGRKMVEQKNGNIINIASVRGLRVGVTSPGWTKTGRTMTNAYPISKAGVIMLTRVLALELASCNIRVNAIAPWVVKSKLGVWDNPELEKQYSALAPLGRICEPDDIAASALFLASDASSYITGHTIVIDGGVLA